MVRELKTGTIRFGEHIRRFRQESGISQTDLATFAGYSPQYVCDIELCRRPVSDNVVKDFSEALGVDETLAHVWAGRLPPQLRDLGDVRAEALADLLRKFANGGR